MLSIPLNRVVAFAGPYIAIVSGAVAAWLLTKVNIAGIPGLDEHNVETAVGAGLTFGLTSGLAWLGHQKWLTGHHIEMLAQAEVTAAALAPTPPARAAEQIDGELVDPESEDAPPAVSDETEFSAPPPDETDAPPPDETNTPVQPSQLPVPDSPQA
jgi:hypothetical protein